MKLRNPYRKGRWFTIKVNGYPQNIYIGAGEFIELEKYGVLGDDSIDLTDGIGDQVKLNGHERLLIRNIAKGKNYVVNYINPIEESSNPIIEIWNWSALGNGFQDGIVYCIESINDVIYAGGSFTLNGDGEECNGIAMLVNDSWQQCGNGLNGTVYRILDGSAIGFGILIVANINESTGGIYSFDGTNINTIDDSNNWIGFDLIINEAIYFASIAVKDNNYYIYTSELGGDSYYAEIVGGNPYGTIFTSNIPYFYGAFNSYLQATLVNNISEIVGVGQWNDVGLGVSGSVYCLKSFSGSLYTGGEISHVSGDTISVNNVAMWNGETWSDVGGGTNNYVLSIVDYGGDLYMGGAFSAVSNGTIPMNCITRWDGENWNDVGSGITGNYENNVVSNMCVFNDELYITGAFIEVSGTAVANIAKWNGSVWSDVGYGLAGGGNCLLVYRDVLYVGGVFTLVSGGTISSNYIAGWDGNNWITLGEGVSGEVKSMCEFDDKLYVGCADGLGNSKVFSWFDSAWEDLGYVFVGGNINSLRVYNDELYIAGNFTSIKNLGGKLFSSGKSIAKWDRNQIVNIGETNGLINVLYECNNKFFVGGAFSECLSLNNLRALAKLSLEEEEVSEVGDGVIGAIYAADVVDDNKIYVGGNFEYVSGSSIPAKHIAIWNVNESSWENMGSGITEVVTAIKSYSGIVYVAASTVDETINKIYSWNGNEWKVEGEGFDSAIRTIKFYDNKMYIGGDFTEQSGETISKIAIGIK